MVTEAPTSMTDNGAEFAAGANSAPLSCKGRGHTQKWKNKSCVLPQVVGKFNFPFRQKAAKLGGVNTVDVYVLVGSFRRLGGLADQQKNMSYI